MALTPAQRRQIDAALLAAFPTEADLARLLLHQLDVPLPQVAARANLQQMVFELVQWAEAQGRLHDLIQGAAAENPDNAQVQALLEQIDTIPDVPSAPVGMAPVPSVGSAEWRNRQVMLKRVRETWITGLLEHSLAEATRLELGLKEAPDAVTDPRLLWLTEVDRPPQPLPPGTTIVDVYDRSTSGLLILGAPGAGKTTLLELTRTLLNRAGADSTQPIPVVVPLTSWAARRPPLTEWLVTELSEKYQVQLPSASPGWWKTPSCWWTGWTRWLPSTVQPASRR